MLITNNFTLFFWEAYHFCPPEADPPLAENHAFILSQNSMRSPISSNPTKINYEPGVSGVKSATRPIIIKRTPIIF
jgi:hypothetical protein